MPQTQLMSDSELIQALKDKKALKKLPLMEVFGPTVQGEGSVIGQQTYFLRFGLCDYKCTYCDSMHAVDPHNVHANAMWLDQEEIFGKLVDIWKPDSTKWVTLSGGNPAIHDLWQLMTMFHRNRWKVAIETQGTFTQPWIDACDVITVSPKLHSMWLNVEQAHYVKFLTRYRDHKGLAVKIVIFGPEDLEEAAHLFKTARELGVTPDKMYLSQGNPYPPHIKQPWSSNDILWMKLRAQYLQMLEHVSRHPFLSQVKFLPQWHVWLWGNKQGV